MLCSLKQKAAKGPALTKMFYNQTLAESSPNVFSKQLSTIKDWMNIMFH